MSVDTATPNPITDDSGVSGLETRILNKAFAVEDDEPVETSEESTETITPTQDSAPETVPPGEAVESDRGDGRDAKGRFVSKEQAEMQAGEEPPAKAVEGTEDAQAPTDAAKAPEESPQGADQPTTPSGEPGSSEPFSVVYGNRAYGIPGAIRTSDGIVVPLDQETTLKQYIGRGLKYEAESGNLKRNRAELSVAQEQFAAETGPIMEEVGRMFGITNITDDQQFAEAWLTYGLELRQSMPILKERVELSKQRAQFAIQQRMATPDPEAQVAQLAQSATFTALGHLGAWKAQPQFKDMADEDWAQVAQAVQSDPAMFLRRVGPNPNEQERAVGAVPGEVVFDADRLLWLASKQADYRTRFVRAEVDARKAIEQAAVVARTNANRRAVGAPPPPPTAPPAGEAPVADSATEAIPKTMDELRQKLGVAF